MNTLGSINLLPIIDYDDINRFAPTHKSICLAEFDNIK